MSVPEKEARAKSKYDHMSASSLENRGWYIAFGITGVSILEEHGIIGPDMRSFLTFVRDNEHLELGYVPLGLHTRELEYISTTAEEAYVKLRETVAKTGLVNHIDDPVDENRFSELNEVDLEQLALLKAQLDRVDGFINAAHLIETRR